MHELYTRYYEGHLGRSDSQRLNLKSFAVTARKYNWNYHRFLRDVAKDAAILDIGCGVGQLLFYSVNIIATARKHKHA